MLLFSWNQINVNILKYIYIYINYNLFCECLQCHTPYYKAISKHTVE